MFGLIFAGLLVLAAIFMVRVIRPQIKDPVGRAMSLGVVVVMILLAIMVVSFSVVHTTPLGYRSVVSTFGKVEPTPLNEGLNWPINPMSDIEDVDVRVQKLSETQDAETSDTQTVKVTLLLNWHPNPTEVSRIYQEVGPHFADKLLLPATQEVLKSEVAKYRVSELIMNRNKIKTAIEDGLKEWLEDDGLKMDSVSIGDIDFSDRYDQAIEAKQVAEQRALQALNELEQSKTDASRAQATAAGVANARIEQARGDKESQILAANGEAESLRVRGQAQADYNKAVSDSLTPSLLQLEYYKTWNGTLPTTLMPGDNISLLLPMK